MESAGAEAAQTRLEAQVRDQQEQLLQMGTALQEALFFIINILEWKLDLCSLDLRRIHSEDPPPLDRERSFCSHLGKEPSPEEALEERNLLESIAWPETQPWLHVFTPDPDQ
ncbi:hypothetical protein J4Q44_G00055150 [Coregonus suidteri]|uniref:Uncharacterized protein n=1 Tax=Coregonus suidteri TaxID=861788 RepID=A0AAN8NA83_9TELE